jgi:hypothetical protein
LQQYPQQYPQQQYQGNYPQPMAYGPVAPPPGGQFGDAGQFIISADRLFGLSFWSASQDQGNNITVKESGTAINLLFGSDSNVLGPYSTPRLGFDYTVTKSVTIGGTIGFISRGGSTDTDTGNGTTSVDSPTVTGFVFAPRGGYILVINPMMALWLRGGLSYFTASSESQNMNTTTTTTTNGFSLNLEPQFVVTPVPHFGFSAGLLGDIPLSGNQKTETTGVGATSVEHSTTIRNFGLTLGLLGYI